MEVPGIVSGFMEWCGSLWVRLVYILSHLLALTIFDRGFLVSRSAHVGRCVRLGWEQQLENSHDRRRIS